MSPSKIKEAAAVKRRQTAIINAVEAAGSMTMAEILGHFSGTKRSISQGAVGYMIRIGMLVSSPTQARTKNGNIISTYSVGGGEYVETSAQEPEPFALGEVWGKFSFTPPVGEVRCHRLGR